MKTAAKGLALLLCAALAAGPARAQAPDASSAPARGAAGGPALIGVTPEVPMTAAEKRELERENLKKLRAGGGATAGVGMGLMGYAIVADLAGPFGLAATLIFLGAVTAYMAHRQLKGELGRNDLPLVTPAPAAAASAPAGSSDTLRSNP